MCVCDLCQSILFGWVKFPYSSLFALFTMNFRGDLSWVPFIQHVHFMIENIQSATKFKVKHSCLCELEMFLHLWWQTWVTNKSVKLCSSQILLSSVVLYDVSKFIKAYIQNNIKYKLGNLYFSLIIWRLSSKMACCVPLLEYIKQEKF